MKKRWKITLLIISTVVALSIVWCISPFPKQIAENTAKNYLKQHYPDFIVVERITGDTKISQGIFSYRSEYFVSFQNDKESVLINVSPAYLPIKVTSAQYLKNEF